MVAELRLKYALFTFENFDKKSNLGVYKSIEPSKEDLEDVMKAIQNAKLDGKDKELVLYKCEDLSELYHHPMDTLSERTRQWLKQHHETPLDPEFTDSGSLNQLFPNGASNTKPISFDLIVITTADLQDLNAIKALPRTIADASITIIKERREQMNQFRATPSPSEGMSNAEEIRKFVQDNRIRNGCPARNFALPSALYSPILADLAHTLTDSELNKIDPTPQVLDLAYRLIRDLIRSYDRELDREQQLRETLDGTFLDSNGGFFQQHSGADGPKAKPEYFWPLALIYELKNIKGMRGDPTLQAVLDYLKLSVDPKWVDFTRKSNCPCLSLGISETQIEIACFVFAREVHFDSLFVDNVRDGFDLHSRVLRLARVLTTVLRTLNLLKSFYRELQNAPLLDNSQRFFPQPVPLASAPPMPKFQFLQRLYPKLDDPENPAPGVFIGIMEESSEDGSYTEGDRVVVKFSTRYNAHAQELLARMDRAPSVYYSQRLRGADFIMTIMEHVEGTMVSKWEDELPREFYTKLKSAITLLHEAGYVFGDLRAQNVLVGHGTDPIILDFDWVALAGKGRYPASINPGSVFHDWAPGVERNGLMQKEHDLHMLQTFEALCCQA